MRILIAEDQPELRRMLVKNLTAAGYTVDGVPDGAGGAGASGRGSLRRSGAGHHDAESERADGAADAARPGQRPPAGAAADSPGRRGRPGRRTGRGRGRLSYQALCHGRAAGAAAGTDPEGSGSTNVYTLADLTVDTAARTAKRGGRTLELSAWEYAPAGIPDPQQGRGAVPAADRGQPVEPGLRRGHQCGGRIHQLSAEEAGAARGAQAAAHGAGHGLGAEGGCMRNISIKWRMTLWFSLLMIAITALMLVFVMLMNRNTVTRAAGGGAAVHGGPERR